MSYAPCLNPNCKSYGHPHPNCRCGQSMAEGGEVSSVCASSGIHGMDCQYYAEGGQVDFTPDSAAAGASQDPQSPALDFTPDDQSAAKEAKYGTLPQQAMSAVEGFGKGLAGPLSTLAETKLGVKGEDIQGREEANPATHSISEGVGLVLPALASDGASLSQAGALNTLGEAASSFVGASGAVKTAVKLGTENALLALGDEVSKKIQGNPSSVQAAAAHVGLSGLLGGVVGLPLGAASNLWVNKVAPKAEPFVNDFVKTLKGEPLEVPFIPSENQPIKNLWRPGTPITEQLDARKGVGAAPTAGQKAAELFMDKIQGIVGEGLGDSVGGAAGHAIGRLTGIPGLGALGGYLGHSNIAPIVKQYLPTIAKTLMLKEGSAAGLKAAFDTIDAVVSGESAVTDAAKGLFETGTNTTFNLFEQDHKHLQELDDRVHALSQDPSGMLNVGGDTGYYMPEHGTAVAATAQNAVNYLNTQRPMPHKPGILDAIIEPSPAQTAAYFRTLGIAEQPLVVMKYLKEGTLHPKDMQDLNALYPDLVPNITQKVNNNLIDHTSKGHSVPFKMRWGLTQLMGQPMDSLFTSPSILAAQATHAPQQPQQAQQGPQKGSKGAPSRLKGKTAELAQTPTESRIDALQKA